MTTFLSALVLSSSLSSPLLPLSLSPFSVSLSLSVSVWSCVLCCGVVCGLCGVWCETLKNHVFEWTHEGGGVFIGKTSVFDICFAS